MYIGLALKTKLKTTALIFQGDLGICYNLWKIARYKTHGWLCMRVWRMSSRRTKRAIISWAGSLAQNFLGISTINEPAHEIMAFFVLRKLNLQTRMRSHPVGLDVLFLVRHFVYFHTLCVRTAKALARLRGCAGSPEPLLVAYVISTKIL